MLQGYVGVLLEICFFKDPRGEASLLICRYDENPKILDIFFRKISPIIEPKVEPLPYVEFRFFIIGNPANRLDKSFCSTMMSRHLVTITLVFQNPPNTL